MTALDATRAAFLADVIAHPDDDTPRLIFADWLEEHGEAARGEFIRVQCEMAQLRSLITDERDNIGLGWSLPKEQASEMLRLNRREAHLWSVLGPPQLPPRHAMPVWTYTIDATGSPPSDFYVTVRRGFVEAVTLPAADWLAHADALLRAHPIREVRLTTWPCYRSRVSIGSTPMGEFWALHPGWSVDEPQTIAMHHSREMLVNGVLKKRWPLITFHLPA